MKREIKCEQPNKWFCATGKMIRNDLRSRVDPSPFHSAPSSDARSGDSSLPPPAADGTTSTDVTGDWWAALAIMASTVTVWQKSKDISRQWIKAGCYARRWPLNFKAGEGWVSQQMRMFASHPLLTAVSPSPLSGEWNRMTVWNVKWGFELSKHQLTGEYFRV